MTQKESDQNLTYQQQLNIKVYSRWVADKLKTAENITVNDITKDFKDGIAVLHLAKILTKETFPQLLLKNSLGKQNEVGKLDHAIKMFNDKGVIFGVKQNTVCGEDINNGNVRQILFFVWVLIKNYSIDKAVHEDKLFKFDKSNMDDEAIETKNKIQLLQWATNKIQDYKNIGKKFTPYDLSICALLHSYLPKFKLPNEFEYDSLNPDDHEKNIQIAIQLMEKVGIPVYIYSDDIKENGYLVDDSSLMTQLAAIKIYLDKEFPFRDSVISRNPNLYRAHLKNEQSERSKLIQEYNANQNQNSNEQNEAKVGEEEEDKENEGYDYDEQEEIEAFRKLFNKEIEKREKKWKEQEQEERKKLLEEQRQMFVKELEERERTWKNLLEEQKKMFMKLLKEKGGDGSTKGSSSHKKIKLTIKSKFDQNPEKPLSLSDNNNDLSVTPIFNDSNGKKLKVKVVNEQNCIEKTYDNPATGLKIVLNENK